MLESNDYQLEKCGMNAVQYKGQTATQDNHNGAATPAARLFKILNITSTPDSHPMHLCSLFQSSCSHIESAYTQLYIPLSDCSELGRLTPLKSLKKERNLLIGVQRKKLRTVQLAITEVGHVPKLGCTQAGHQQLPAIECMTHYNHPAVTHRL